MGLFFEKTGSSRVFGPRLRVSPGKGRSRALAILSSHRGPDRHEAAPPQVPLPHGKRCRRCGAAARELRAELPDAPGAHHRRAGGGELVGHHGAARRAVRLGAARAAVHRRGAARRRRQHRDRGGRGGCARRLHRSPRQRAEHHQPGALRPAQLQLPARHRAGRRHPPRAAGDGGAAVVPGEDRSGVHRLCQGQSGQDQHGLGRHRRAASRRRRTVQVDGRRRPRARALSRLDPGADRSPRRARSR